MMKRSAQQVPAQVESGIVLIRNPFAQVEVAAADALSGTDDAYTDKAGP
jgi:hypothetical protein